MFPYFLDGDILTFDRNGPFRRGDVIVYLEPGGDRYIIHRIIRVIGTTINTGGDNNNRPDHYSLSAGDIIGKVTLITRVRVEIPVWNGLSGYLAYLYRKRYQRYIHEFIHFFQPLYRAASRPPILRRLCRKLVIYHPLVIFKPDGAIMVRMYLNTWYAAWAYGREGVWHIRTPYRLLIDESDLPDLNTTVKEVLNARIDEMKRT